MHRTHGVRARPAKGRLSRSADFDRVFRHGRSHAGREFVLYVFPRPDQATARIGVSVSRKVGGAVDRNRIKRLLREALNDEACRLPEGMDAVVVARQDAKALGEREGLAGVQRALRELLEHLGDGSSDRGGAPRVEPDAAIVAAVNAEPHERA